MTTVKDIIERVDAEYFNTFEPEVKLRWFSLLEGKIAADVFLMHPVEVAQYQYS